MQLRESDESVDDSSAPARRWLLQPQPPTQLWLKQIGGLRLLDQRGGGDDAANEAAKSGGLCAWLQSHGDWIFRLFLAVAEQMQQQQQPSKKQRQPVVKDDEAALDEYKRLYQEHVRLKRVLDILKGEYEDSKCYEVFRRYGRLKGMIKRTVMYTKLDAIPDVTCALGLGSLVMMSTGITGRKLAAVASIPEVPRAELPDKVRELRKSVSRLRQDIDEMARLYEVSKQYIAVQRYRLMKAMVKRAVSGVQ